MIVSVKYIKHIKKTTVVRQITAGSVTLQWGHMSTLQHMRWSRHCGQAQFYNGPRPQVLQEYRVAYKTEVLLGGKAPACKTACSSQPPN